MSKSTGTNIGANLILAAFGTAMLVPLQFDSDPSLVPTETIAYQKLTTNSWEGDIIISEYHVDPKIDTIKSFTKNLLKNTSDIDPEIMEVVNESYWDLL
jgi:phosphomannomutase